MFVKSNWEKNKRLLKKDAVLLKAVKPLLHRCTSRFKSQTILLDLSFMDKSK